LCLLLRLRSEHYDIVILAENRFSNHTLKLAKVVNAKQIMAVVPASSESKCIDLFIPESFDASLHEVKHCFALRDLIAGVDCCDQFICSDGGAMHIAADLGKPLLCFFGDSNAQQWHPWQVPHQLLQPESKQINDISPKMAVEAFIELNIK
jgi:ADP-heptose:LPS heptosyltransferase